MTYSKLGALPRVRQSGSPDGFWDLRSDDLPSCEALARAGLGDLENNAVFRLLIRHHHRVGRRRRGLVIGYTLGWLLAGTLYSNFVFGASWDQSFAFSLGLTLIVLIWLANVFMLAGIEGYETNGNLRSAFADIITSGIPSGEIARGILGRTSSHYNTGPLRVWCVLVCAIHYALILYLHWLRAAPFLLWSLPAGIFGAAQLFVLLGSLPWIPLPGVLFWYRMVRGSYQRRYDSVALGINRNVKAGLAISAFLMSAVCVIFVPPLLYLIAGLRLLPYFLAVRSMRDQAFILLAASLIAALAGALAGAYCRGRARLRFDANLQELEQEVDKLFRLRAYFIFENPQETE